MTGRRSPVVCKSPLFNKLLATDLQYGRLRPSSSRVVCAELFSRHMRPVCCVSTQVGPCIFWQVQMWPDSATYQWMSECPFTMLSGGGQQRLHLADDDDAVNSSGRMVMNALTRSYLTLSDLVSSELTALWFVAATVNWVVSCEVTQSACIHSEHSVQMRWGRRHHIVFIIKLTDATHYTHRKKTSERNKRR